MLAAYGIFSLYLETCTPFLYLFFCILFFFFIRLSSRIFASVFNALRSGCALAWREKKATRRGGSEEAHVANSIFPYLVIVTLEAAVRYHLNYIPLDKPFPHFNSSSTVLLF